VYLGLKFSVVSCYFCLFHVRTVRTETTVEKCTAILLLKNLLATEHTHNNPHDTTKIYTECEAFTSLE